MSCLHNFLTVVTIQASAFHSVFTSPLIDLYRPLVLQASVFLFTGSFLLLGPLPFLFSQVSVFASLYLCVLLFLSLSVFLQASNKS